MKVEAIKPESSTALDSTVERARVLNALGDPIRLAIADLLQLQDLSPDQLADCLGVAGNLLSHHLKVLQEAGVVARVHSQADRRRTYVQLKIESFAGLLPGDGGIRARRVVFVCTENSARSILADAIWQTVSEIPSASAGTHPAARINPKTLSAARRKGLSVFSAKPHSIDEVLRKDDLVVSVCDAVNEELVHMANPRIHWSIPDPARVGTEKAFDSAVAELQARVICLAPRIVQSRTRTRRTRSS
ncbi:MAG: helix-turn-helix domain-containing protein [Actinomycetota bacterium]|nr:helix-turn-helix domain-containing protein [Actinomycetota bacterium]